jgi:hypothetical protein
LSQQTYACRADLIFLVNVEEPMVPPYPLLLLLLLLLIVVNGGYFVFTQHAVPETFSNFSRAIEDAGGDDFFFIIVCSK